MRLRTYRELSGLTPAEFAARIGITIESVRRYEEGLRIPRPEIMARITAATNGAVTANDFYQQDAA